jgi:CRP/FNR family transcriptional regulator, cyclic AMP receptor protein
MRIHADPKLDLLREIPVFAGLSNDELDTVAAVADEIDVPAGRALAVEGAIGHEFVVLVDGTVEVDRGGETIATLGPGDFFGEIALATRSRRTATVTTTSPARLLVLDDRGFRSLMGCVPAFSSRVWAAAAQRLATA